MPRRRYNSSEVNTLESFSPLSNFNVRSLTFVNNIEGIKIDDAITITEEGEVVFKDTETEVTLTELIEGSNGILEETEENGDTTLYFLDDNNNKISLGRVYELLFKENVVNGVFWFGERSSKFLNDEMDEYILEEYYDKADDGNVDPRSLSILFEETDSYKNIWFDVPCIEVITPDYVDGKYASISAKVCFKMKCELSTITAFRIYDATTGLELSRTVQVIRSTPDEYVSYTVPLSYQGPLPDSIQENEGVCREVTINDLQNVEFVNGEEKGSAITKGFNGYYRIPNTKHIIKLQWATCSSTIELDTIGLPVGDFKRQFDSRGETSLDVVVYDKNDTFNADRFRQFSGTIPVDPSNDTYVVDFLEEKITIDDRYDYAVKLSTNRNFEAWVKSKTPEQLHISWNKTPNRGEIDWIIIQENKEQGEQLSRLNDDNRSLNHFLFGSKIVDADFCGEYLIPPPEIDFFLDDTDDIIPEDECECCDCCADVKLDDIAVEYIVWGGSEIRPDCDCGEQYYTAQDSNGDVRYATNPSELRFEVIVEENITFDEAEDDGEFVDDEDFDDNAGAGFGEDINDNDESVGTFIDSEKCIAIVLGETSNRGKLNLDTENQNSKYVSLAELGITLETESYTNIDNGVSTRSQRYSVSLITVDNDSEIWIESQNYDGFIIQWDPDAPPKYGICYYNLKTTTFVSPNEEVRISVEPKRNVCLNDPSIVTTEGTGNIPIAELSNDDSPGEKLDNETNYDNFQFLDDGETIFVNKNNWSDT